MLKRLRIKFICILMCVVTVVVCVAFGLVVYSTWQTLERDSIRLLNELARPVPGHEFRDYNKDAPRIPHLILQADLQGNVLAMGVGFSDMEDPTFLTDVWESAMESEQSTGVLKEHKLRFLRKDNEQPVTIYCLDTSREQDTLRSLAETCSILGGSVLLVFWGVSVLLARWAVAPVETSWNQQRQFVADASHELKTPLTVILANTDMLQDPCFSDGEKQVFTQNIQTMSHQMRELVEGLLQLARIDNHSQKQNFSEVDLSQLISDGLLPFDALFYEKGLALSGSIESSILVQGQEGQLKQVLDILLDNAMKYAFPNTAVNVILTRSRNCCTLTVESTGPHIPTDQCKKIFKRFYRMDTARQRTGSYGLGLSIAEGIVLLHRGKIWAESTGNQNLFHVQLPTI